MAKATAKIAQLGKELKTLMKQGNKTKALETIDQGYAGLQGELTAADAELGRFLRTVAREVGLSNVKVKTRIKPLGSVKNKVVDRGKDFGDMADLVAGSLYLPNDADPAQVLNHIQRKYAAQVRAAEAKTGEGDKFGYHGTYHVDLVLPGSGITAEIQIMTKKLRAYKDAAHEIYSQYRATAAKDIPKGELDRSRKLFKIGNQKVLKEALDELIAAGILTADGTLVEGVERLDGIAEALNERYEYGNPHAPRKQEGGREGGKRTGEEERAVAGNSSIFKSWTSPEGWKIVSSVHAAAQAFDRRPEFKFDDWKKLHGRVAKKLESFTRWTGNEFVFFSRSLDQGYVAAVDKDSKSVKIITVLPKGKNQPKAGTAKILLEFFGVQELEVFFLD